MYDRQLITGGAGQSIVTGRASVGIYLVLQHLKQPGKGVLVPANLCYAGIYPALYAGFYPVFCDVDALSGNVTEKSFSSACTPEIAAAVIPHMYGNPVRALPEIRRLCQNRGIVLIEDCASAMGAEAHRYSLGETGDYTVYSTGYSKTLDLGFGGILTSLAYPLESMEAAEQALPVLTEQSRRELALFSKLYRLLRNEGSGTTIESMIFAGLPDCCRNGFLHKLDPRKKDWLVRQLDQLPEIIRKRRVAQARYAAALSVLPAAPYPYENGAVPWRFNLFLEPKERGRVIAECLSRGLPVSDWYPQVTPMFQYGGDFPGARWHETHILNFPLLLSEQEIDRICETVLEVLHP